MNSKKTASDKRLLVLAQKGDKNAFAQLIVKYQLKIKRLGLSFFKNEADAEDFIQDVFIKVYINLSKFRFGSEFSTWLMRIAYNTAINSINRNKQYLPLSENLEIPDSDLGPEEKELHRITKLAINETLKELPERFAMCLDLYFFYDLSLADISEILDIPLNTVKSHVFRAKKLLKQKLEEIL